MQQKIKCPNCNHVLSVSIKTSKINKQSYVNEIKKSIFTQDEKDKFISFVKLQIQFCDDYDVNQIIFLSNLIDKITNL